MCGPFPLNDIPREVQVRDRTVPAWSPLSLCRTGSLLPILFLSYSQHAGEGLISLTQRQQYISLCKIHLSGLH